MADLKDQLIESLNKQIALLERENNSLRTHPQAAASSLRPLLSRLESLGARQNETLISFVRTMCRERDMQMKVVREKAVGIADRAGRGILIDALIETMTKSQAGPEFEQSMQTLAAHVRKLTIEEIAQEIREG